MPCMDQEDKGRPGQTSYSELELAGQGGQGRVGRAGQDGQGRMGRARKQAVDRWRARAHRPGRMRTSQEDRRSSSVDLHMKVSRQLAGC